MCRNNTIKLGQISNSFLPNPPYRSFDNDAWRIHSRQSCCANSPFFGDRKCPFFVAIWHAACSFERIWKLQKLIILNDNMENS